MRLDVLLHEVGISPIAAKDALDKDIYDVCIYREGEPVHENILYCSETAQEDYPEIPFLYTSGSKRDTLNYQGTYVVVEEELMDTFNRIHSRCIAENQNMYHMQPFIASVILNTNHDLQALVEKFAHFLNSPIILTNSVYKVLAITDLGEPVEDPVFESALKYGYCSAESIALFEKEGVTQKVLQTDNTFLLSEGLAEKMPRILGKVDVAGETAAYLGILQRGHEFTEQDLQVAQFLCEAVQHEIELDSTLLRKTNIIYESIVHDLFSGSLTEPMVLEERLKASKWETRKHFRCTLITTHSQAHVLANVSYLIDRIRYRFWLKVIRYEDMILVINNYDTSGDWHMQADYMEEEASVFNLKMGVSTEFDNLLNLSEAYEEAKQVVELANKMHLKDTLFYFSAFLPFYLIMNSGVENLKKCKNQYYQRLNCYDLEHDTEYVKTLYYYVLYNCNVNRTANKLSIHRNSLRHRLEKIEEISKIDIDNGIMMQNFVLYHQIQQYLR